ncbi:MAG: di-trans,poly-cis-decaprenylcistransferase [Sulfurimonadaceae bacterium]|nr:di-trans,poly-cis-decaprenylcistransferase [Sulfurimonadaceae bacterium]
MSNIAQHVAIIMDGNGRWAEARGLKRIKGHEKGADAVRAVTEFCAAQDNIKRLTLYTFSTENWKRPKLEVEFLMKMLERYLRDELPTYLKNNIRFEPVGDLSRFSASLQKTIEEVRTKTAHCDGLTQSLALNYGSKDEIVRAVNRLITEGKSIDEEAISEALDCPCDIDLLIRTGGDHRLSNFLLWQAAYAELFFTDTLWPDFDADELKKIIGEFTTIERRFGGLK